MDEETRRRCLEPFFTTKGERGTGLGLAMVYGMAQRHGARLEIESQPGAGTTHPLPLSGATPRPRSAVRGAAQAPARSLRMLIVDDDPAADRVAAQHARGGRSRRHDRRRRPGRHRCLPGGRAQAGSPFDVVITDLGMPYVDGRQVIENIRAHHRPKRPIILLTGWGQRVLAESSDLPQADRLLSKPPRLHELRTALAELTG